jgi:hypothetical protein
MRIVTLEEFSLLGPLPLMVAQPQQPLECTERRTVESVSLNILADLVSVNIRMTGVLLQLAQVSNSMANYAITRRMLLKNQSMGES